MREPDATFNAFSTLGLTARAISSYRSNTCIEYEVVLYTSPSNRRDQETVPMAMPALKFESENPMEECVAVLEANIGHIRADVSDTKTEIRKLNDKVDGVYQKLTAKVDGVNRDLTAKIDGLNRHLTANVDGLNRHAVAKIDGVKDAQANFAVNMERHFTDLKVGRMLDRLLWLLMSAALLAIMARAYKWL